jgi:predicted acyltransferase
VQPDELTGEINSDNNEESGMNKSQHDEPQTDRIMSIDALRGFDMFWIVGGHGFVLSALALLADPLPEWLKRQFEHVPWEGFTAWDLIMPLFLFIVGTSMPFAFSKRRRQGQTTVGLYLRVLRRVLILYVFGMIVQGHLLAFKLDELRLFSNTLQAIAVGYLVAAFALVYLRISGQLLLTIGLLVAYWLLMSFVPFGDHPAGTQEERANLALYVDQLILGRFEDGKTYTWILSSLGFAATVLMGVLSGHLIRLNRPPALRVGCLWASGAGCLLAGWLWSFHFSINKHIWSSSMALWSGGWCFLLLGLFHLVIDVWGWRRWAFPFVVIGMNAITAYMAWHVLHLDSVSGHLLGGLALHLSERGATCLLNAGPLVLLWLMLYYMYGNRTFLKV